MDLVIVESPAKAKTIEGYLGDNYQVLSSVGHITNLATSGPGGLGVDIEHNFKPTYKIISGKQKIVKELKAASKEADKVYIATDLDREGEAIGYHLMEELGLDFEQANRIVFSEITKDGIKQGIENPRKLDLNLVHSQETRRIIDRIIGFKLSALLKQKIKAQSAGRVQSVALKMIVEREREITAFKPQTYYKLVAIVDNIEFNYCNNDQQLNQQQVTKLFNQVKNHDLIINNIDTQNKTIQPKKPYITSTFQQDCINKLGFSSKKAMRIAQKLYEGIEINGQHHGLITYMRTDSYRLSSSFMKSASSKIKQLYGSEYVGVYHAKKDKNAQDAHEAIRPTYIELTPEIAKGYLTKDEFKVYNLIYKRSLMSLMAPAKMETKTYTAMANGVEFKTSSSSYPFLGFKKLDEYEEQKVIDVTKNQVLVNPNYEITQHQTQPKPRYTEARLIKELEANGVGRPSTYAGIIDILKQRNYVQMEEKKFVPTEDGELVTDKLAEFFDDIINVEYTSELETSLDEIAADQAEELNVLETFYQKFSKKFDIAQQQMEKIQAKSVGELCPECGSDLVERKGKFGKFIACSNYPQCHYVKQQRNVVGICPQCGGEVVEKRTKKGKIMYGCCNYPKCDYATWNLKDVPQTN